MRVILVLMYLPLVVTAGYLSWQMFWAVRSQREEEARRDGYRRQIAQDPSNTGSYEELAASLERGGRLAEARTVYGQLLEQLPEYDRGPVQRRIRLIDVDIANRRGVRPGLPRLQRAAGESETLFCPLCGYANPRGAQRCPECGEYLFVMTLLQSGGVSWRDRKFREPMRDFIIGAVIVASLLIGYHYMPFDLQCVLALASTITCGWYMLRSIEGRRG